MHETDVGKKSLIAERCYGCALIGERGRGGERTREREREREREERRKERFIYRTDSSSDQIVVLMECEEYHTKQITGTVSIVVVRRELTTHITESPTPGLKPVLQGKGGG